LQLVNVPFANLSRAAEALRPELEKAAAGVIYSGSLVLGQQGAAFEHEFARTVGATHAIGVGSGSDAVELALRALSIGPGDEVVTQANTCVPTVGAIARAGARPVLCDVEPEAATMDPESLRKVLGPRTKAVVPVHLFGQCADVDRLQEVVGDVPIVEDAAQAHGAQLRGRCAGTMGVLGCFSFYPTKNLGGLGEGGAVTTSDDTLAERVRMIRHHGQPERDRHLAAGVNSRLDELQAALLRVKLPHLEQWNRRRAEIAAHYTEALEDTQVRPLSLLPDRRHVFHLFVVEAPERARFQAELDRRGVATLIHYSAPIHRLPPYRALGDGRVSLTNSERLCERIVSLPLYPELTDQEIQTVAAAAREAARA
jgi:dTDP-4-amino-4,6-dideoxygalactose transaminase